MIILSVHNSADIYGASRCLLRMMTLFVKDGHEVHVVLPCRGPLVRLLEKSGVISGLEADGIRAGTHVLQAVENVKTYSTNDQLNPTQSDFPNNARNGGETP